MKEKILLNFFKKHAVSYLAGICLMFLASYIQTLFPKILGKTVDLMKTGHFQETVIIKNIFNIIIIAITAFCFTYLWRSQIIGNCRKFECYLREKLFHHFETLSPQFYSNQKTGDLIAYAINDISAVRMTFGPAMAMSINGLVVCLSSIYFMLTAIDLRLTLITLTPLPIVIFMLFFIGQKIQARFKTVQENFGALSDKVQENINGIRVIKSFVQEEQEIRNFETLCDQMLDSSIKLVKTSALLSPVIEICFSLSFALNLIIGGNMVLNGTISLGSFVAFNTHMAMIMAPITSIGRVVTFFQRGMASLKRLMAIFQVTPAIIDEPGLLNQTLTGAIEIRDLDFKYPGATTPALRKINLKIAPGQTLGIVGNTGSGKSTIANLLLKLYNAPPGTIFMDGTDINHYSPQAIRQNIGLVPQEIFLFAATIKDNVTSFKDIYSATAIHKVLRLSHIEESIRQLPNGLNTVLGERGVNLSGGQKQRLAIARAIIKEPPLLILDDALSAVDTVTQNLILKDLKEFRKGQTNIIISHRISTVAEADTIIVLDEGQIVEQGTHAELLEKGGLYYELFSKQTEENRCYHAETSKEQQS